MPTTGTPATRHTSPATHHASLPIPLTAHHLRFTLRATSAISFGSFKGSALRGALAGVLRRTFCPAQRNGQVDALHQALCPVCQLLSWEGDEGTNGDVRRPYAIEPPSGEQNHLAAGETFTFGLALYGDNLAYLPYLVLAVGGMGETGIGQKTGSRRGTFEVAQIEAIHPLSGETRLMLAPGERMVRSETLPVTHTHVEAAAGELLEQLAEQNNHLRIDFLTPTRLTQGEHTVKTPLFFPLVKATVLRILDLSAQHAGGRPAIILKHDLYPYADQVHLVEDNTHWWDLKGYSSRLERQQVLGGFVGSAWYYAPDWRPLLPWLLWGMSTHVGKNIVKGCGIYQVVRS